MKHYLSILSLLVMVFAVAGATPAALALDERTVHEERVTEDGDVIVEREVVHDDDDSLVGEVFDAVGEIIAFPFKLVGGILSGVF